MAAGIGRTYALGGLRLVPTLGAAYRRASRESYHEEGAGAANLDIGSYDLDSLRSSVGLRVRHAFGLDGVVVEPRAGLAWEHEFLHETARVDARLMGQPVRIRGGVPGRDSAVASAGLGVRLNESVSLDVAYDGEIRADQVEHAATARVAVNF